MSGPVGSFVHGKAPGGGGRRGGREGGLFVH
jgi:hypothetical protein